MDQKKDCKEKKTGERERTQEWNREKNRERMQKTKLLYKLNWGLLKMCQLWNGFWIQFSVHVDIKRLITE